METNQKRGPSSTHRFLSTLSGRKKDGKWQRRQRMYVATRVIGRLHSANPSEEQQVYLYLLLLHRRGARSFEDLVTVTMPDGSSKTFFEQKWSTTSVHSRALTLQKGHFLATMLRLHSRPKG